MYGTAYKLRPTNPNVKTLTIKTSIIKSCFPRFSLAANPHCATYSSLTAKTYCGDMHLYLTSQISGFDIDMEIT